jgi:hypothetical protein
MAITKRTRFEVLRRDGYTCQYCGAKAPDVVLHIDHIMPKALGGSDSPDNLATACKDCNSGKASIMPDSPLVQGLSEKAAAYALGMVDKMTRIRATVDTFEDYLELFTDRWNSWVVTATQAPIKLPADHELSIYRWHAMGIPLRLIEMSIPKAMMRPGLRGPDAEFSYMAGIVWNLVKADAIDFSVTSETAVVYTENEADEMRVDGYEIGVKAGRERGIDAGFAYCAAIDFVQHHIDGTSSWMTEKLGAEVIPSGAGPSEHPY